MVKKILKFCLKLFVVVFVLLNIVCMFHAYKFTHFYSEKIEVKKPEQLTFGDKLSAGIFGVKFPKNASNDSLLTVEHSKILLLTDDNIKLEAWQSNETLQNKKGTIIFFHGHGGNKAGLINEAIELHKMGYAFLLIDFRAHGNSESNVCTIGYKESKDVKAAYNYVKQTGEKNIVLYGVSLGAATIIKACATDSINPTKVILDMPFASLHLAVQGRVTIMGLPKEPIATLLTFWGGVEQGFWAFNMEPQEYAKSIKCPVLLQRGANDVRVTKDETEKIFNNITSQKKFVVYTNSSHQSFCKNENEKWKNEMISFLEK